MIKLLTPTPLHRLHALAKGTKGMAAVPWVSFGRASTDALCQALGIEHRLTKPKHPQTNGMVERFNGRLEQVLRTHRFNSAHDLETTLLRFVWLYNVHLPQRALDLTTPIQALTKWQATHPDLFVKRVVNHPGPDN